MTLDNDPAGVFPPLGVFSYVSLSQFLPRHVLIATLVITLVARYVRSPWRRVPPGPKGLPILGNALQLQNKSWMFGKECKRNFGTFGSFFFLTDSMTLRIYHTTSQNISCI